jgi:hypothetical protein
MVASVAGGGGPGGARGDQHGGTGKQMAAFHAHGFLILGRAAKLMPEWGRRVA